MNHDHDYNGHHYGDYDDDDDHHCYHHSYDDDDFVQLAKETDTNSCTFSKLPDILGSGQPYEVKIKTL